MQSNKECNVSEDHIECQRLCCMSSSHATTFQCNEHINMRSCTLLPPQPASQRCTAAATAPENTCTQPDALFHQAIQHLVRSPSTFPSPAKWMVPCRLYLNGDHSIQGCSRQPHDVLVVRNGPPSEGKFDMQPKIPQFPLPLDGACFVKGIKSFIARRFFPKVQSSTWRSSRHRSD